MRVTRSASKRPPQAQVEAEAREDKKRANQRSQHGAASQETGATPGTSIPERVRKHKSQLLVVREVYDKKDWQAVAEQLQQFRSNPRLGRLNIPFDFRVRAWAAKLPLNIAVNDLAPLTNLTRLCCTGEGLLMKGANLLDLPSSVQLPRLKIADLGSGTTGARQVAAFMPNVQQLQCRRLDIAARPASTSEGTCSGTIAIKDVKEQVLKHCTHYGGSDVHVCRVNNAEDAGRAFASVFPSLKVITDAPCVTGYAAFEKGIIPHERYHGLDYPRYCSALTALKLTPCDALWRYEKAHPFADAAAAAQQPGRGLKELANLPNLTTLMIVSLSDGGREGNIAQTDMPYAMQVSRLQFLTQFTFTLDHSTITPLVVQLLQAVLALPRLQSLGMPMHLLCSAGCAPAGMQQTLDQVAIKPSLKQIILLEHKGGFITPGPQSREPRPCVHKTECHAAAERLRAGAVANARSLAEQQQQQQRQQNKQRRQMPARIKVAVVQLSSWLDLKRSRSGLGSEYDWGHPVWGVFGPDDGVYNSTEW